MDLDLVISGGSLYYNAAVVSVAVIIVTSILYICCHVLRARSPKRTRLYGRIHEVHYRSSTKRKYVRIDPFNVTGLDMIRRFEDSVANYLFSVCNEIAVNRLGDYRITFDPHDGTYNDQYKLEYLWMLNHLYTNAREYAYLFTATKDKKMKDAVFKLRSDPLPVEELFEAINSSTAPPYDTLVVHSVSCYFRSISGELTAEAKSRGNGAYILESFDSASRDVREKIRNNVLSNIRKGLYLVEILQALTPNSSKVIKDHYGIISKIFGTFVDEYLPYSDRVLENRRDYQEMDPHTRKELVLGALEEIVQNAHNEEIWEILATTVLPRFRKSLS